MALVTERPSLRAAIVGSALCVPSISASRPDHPGRSAVERLFGRLELLADLARELGRQPAVTVAA